MTDDLIKALQKELRQADDRIAELETELSSCRKGNENYHNQNILDHNRAIDLKDRIAELEMLYVKRKTGDE